jgi:hypothetical protein
MAQFFDRYLIWRASGGESWGSAEARRAREMSGYPGYDAKPDGKIDGREVGHAPGHVP